jgi:hypothetical protein
MLPSSAPMATNSSAERRLFERLSAVNLPEWTCLHSLRLSKHEYKSQSEIDFLLVGPDGILVIEVKGGRIRRGDDGIWIYTDRWDDEYRHSEGPFRQAESAMRSLKKSLEKSLAKSHTDNLTFGWVVSFPDISFDAESVEWDRSQIIDENRVATPSALRESLLGAMAFSKDRQRRGSYVIDQGTIAAVVKELRPRFDRAPSLRFRSEQSEALSDELTTEQYSRFDIVQSNDRVVCTGGAGTGKTFIALEAARRFAETGERVIFLCSQPELRNYLEQRGSVDNIEFIDIAQVSKKPPEPADVLVVDEAQDFMDFEGLGVIETLLDTDLAHGRWRVFLDPNAQAFASGRFDSEAYKYLQDADAAKTNLSRNCRNTSDIVSSTRTFTGADIGTPTAGKGPPVEMVTYHDEADQTRQLERFIQRALSDGAVVSDITILSNRGLQSSSVASLPPYLKSKITVLTAENADSFPFDSICFADPMQFKGLENDIVAIVDIDTVSDNAAWIGAFYVALTRPRRHLWISVSQNAEPVIQQLVEDNLRLINAEQSDEAGIS